MKHKIYFFLIGLVMLSLNSCDNDDKNTQEEQTVTVGLQSANDFAYYSFEKRGTVSQSEDWDIAFWGLNGKTNGGVSGNGNAAVIKTKCKDFEQLNTVAPFVNSEFWEQDVELETKALVGGKITTITKNLNPFLQNKGWFELEEDPIKVTVKENIFIVRTAKGNYVKIQFLEPKEGETVAFKWKFITTTGTNPVEIEVYKLPKVTETAPGEIVLSGNGNLEVLLKKYTQKDLKKLTIKDKIMSQPDCYFIGTMKKIGTLDLSEATLIISDADYGFKNNKNVANLILPESLKAIGFGHLGYSNFETVTFVGENLVRVGSGTFAYANKIKHLELPNSLHILGEESFAIMTALEDIEIPEKVSIIPDHCFFYDIALESVTFKGKVRELGNEVFAYCKKLTKIKFTQSEPPTFNKGEWPFMEDAYFDNEDGTPRVFFYVPKGSKAAYQKAWGFTKDGEDVYFKEY